jgi:arabinose-5-phosphate isomerase
MVAALAYRSDATFDAVSSGREILRAEAAAVAAAAETLGESFDRAVDLLFACRGRVAVSGVGKSSDIGLKFVGTLNSTGTKAYHLDATKAVHGDLGMVDAADVAVLLSHSGESEEVVRLLAPLKLAAKAIVAVTGKPHGTLARLADVAVIYGPLREACPNALAPSTSTTVTLAVCDALALTVSKRRQFTAADFAKFHPAGNLGRKLATVAQLMRTGDDLRIAGEHESVRAVFGHGRHRGRRTGAVMIVRPDGTLSGFFTDSDLARLFENRNDAAFDRPIAEVMTRDPLTVPATARLADAVDLLRGKKISELPVLDGAGRPIGLLDITDAIGEAPRPTLRIRSDD